MAMACVPRQQGLGRCGQFRLARRQPGHHCPQLGKDLGGQQFRMALMFGCHGQALNDDIQIDPNEIEEALWLTRQEVMDMIAGDHPKVRAPRKGAIAGFLLENWVADTLG